MDPRGTRYPYARHSGHAPPAPPPRGAHRMKRLATGGLGIDRTQPLSFSWNGTALRGFAGDTLASALLGAGVRVLGTSVSAGRPR
ncbi:MAG: 2Fe-2S iron-sulfur cluster-binding protein, partial [Gemmatimonas sp.]|uniref:2Fe-2S iron-sulfur cluster-binding protein n=1 Tax=Gemmatimonas sp. TaxID=1962908 RepID=UPI00391C463A